MYSFKSILFLLLIMLTGIMHGQSGKIPEAYYKFSGNADDEQRNVNGVVMNAYLTSDRFGRDSSAYNFIPDSGSAISLGDNFDFFSGTDSKFTFSLWFQLKDPSRTDAVFFSKYGNSTCGEHQREFFITTNDDKLLEFVYYNTLSVNSYRGIQGTTSISDTNWHHLVIIYNGKLDYNDGLDRVEMFLDGNQESLTLGFMDGSLGNIQNSAAHCGIGAPLSSTGELCSGGINSDFIFSGKLDDVIIFSDVLTESEVEQLYYGELSTCINDTIRIYQTIYDTVYYYDTIQYYDTVYYYDTIIEYDRISVTDTLRISVNFPDQIDLLKSNVIKIYPNPTNSLIFINTGDYTIMKNYSIAIYNIQSQTVYERLIDRQEYQIDLSQFGQKGLYLLKIMNPEKEVLEVRKILLE